jgi:uncharacterized membrane protein/protein-disulfide isomerase
VNDQKLDNSWYGWLLIGAGVIGAVLSFLSLQSYFSLQVDPSYVSSCNISATVNCDQAYLSKFSTFLGIPLASYGLVFYAVILFLGITALGVGHATVAASAFVLGLLSVLLSLYLFAISKFVLGVLCPFCIGMYLANFAVFLGSLSVMKHETWSSRTRKGIIQIFRFPKVLLGLGVYKNHKASTFSLLGFLFTVAAILFALSYPSLFNQKGRKGGDPEIQRQIRLAVEKWRSSPPNQVPFDPARDPYKGNVSAKVQLVEFFDFECSACRHLHPILAQVFQEYRERILFVAKNYPLDKSCNPLMVHELHHYACEAAAVSLCAGRQGGYWQASEFLFNLPELVRAEPGQDLSGVFEGGIERLGLKVDEFQRCMRENQSMADIQTHIAQGKELGLDGTPSVWVNGREVKPVNIAILRAVLNEALAEVEAR